MASHDKICSDCKRLAYDVLSGSTHSSTNWRVLRSEQTTLYHTSSHHGGNVEALRASAAGGCGACIVLEQAASAVSGLDAPVFYSIFVRGTAPLPRCQFQITTSDVTAFLKHVQYWPPAKTLEFFGVPTSPSPAALQAHRLGGRADRNGIVGTRPVLALLPNQDPEAAENIVQAKKWLEVCMSSHVSCSRPAAALPKRVLDLTRLEKEHEVSLHISKGETDAYCALSYTWGEGQRLVLNRAGLDDQRLAGAAVEFVARKRVPQPPTGPGKRKFRTVASWPANALPLAAFPRVHADVLRLAAALGFRYIWIDSLCIIQGDGADWTEQGAAMTDIYGGSTLVLSASSSVSSDQPIYTPHLRQNMKSVGMWRDERGSDIGENGPAQHVEVFLGDMMDTLDIEEKATSTRGWVFQERLVSTATLHFTDEGMVWECVTGTALVHDQAVSAVSWKADWHSVIVAAGGHEPRKTPSDPRVTNRIWFNWIDAYSERDLYDSRDKFPAVAGVAKRFQQRFGSKYVAGLWESDLVTGLLWRRHRSTETLVRFRGAEYVGPSWSWASVKGRLEYRSVTLTESANRPLLRVDPAKVLVREEHPGTFGRVEQGASLVAVGELQQVTIDRHMHPGVRQRPHQECGIIDGFKWPENVLCMPDEWSLSLPRHETYWCLRVGSWDASGRAADIFLLLEAVHGLAKTFRRVGIVETDVWADVKAPSPLSGVLQSSTVEEVTLV